MSTVKMLVIVYSLCFLLGQIAGSFLPITFALPVTLIGCFGFVLLAYVIKANGVRQSLVDFIVLFFPYMPNSARIWAFRNDAEIRKEIRNGKG